MTETVQKAPVKSGATSITKGKEKKISFKEITIHAAPNASVLPKKFHDEIRTRVGAFALPGEPAAFRSLSEDEIRQYGGRLIGTRPNSPDFDEKVNEYFNDFAINIPYSGDPNRDDGLKIKIPIDDKGDPRLDDKTKDHVFRIMQYRHVMSCPRVADSKTQYEEEPSFYIAYIEDRAVLKIAQVSGKETRKKAAKYYLEITSEKEATKMDWILELARRGVPTEDVRDMMSGGYIPSVLQGVIDIHELDEDDKELAIEEFKNDRPAEFVNIVEDDDLEWKALLERMIARGVLIRQGNVIMNQNDAVGGDDQEALARLKSSGYSKELVALKSNLANKDKVYE